MNHEDRATKRKQRTPQKRSNTYKVNVGNHIKTISKKSPYDAKKLTQRNYLRKRLHANDAAFYSAAGVLPYRVVTTTKGAQKRHTVEILLGVEDQFDKVKKRVLPDRINFLGGKREKGDMSAENTAVREFWEESGGLLGPESTTRVIQNLETVLWFRNGKYALFLHQLCSRDQDLPKRYSAHCGARPSEMREMKDLMWIPLDLSSDQRSSKTGKERIGLRETGSRRIGFLVGAVLSSLELKRYFQALLKEERGDVQEEEEAEASASSTTGLVPALVAMKNMTLE